MPSDRSFWIITRIAVAEGVIIFTVLMYFLQSDSVNFVLSLGGTVALIAGLLLSAVERKYKNTRQYWQKQSS